MKNKLILLKRKHPAVCEIHIGEIRQTHNILFSTTDENLAKNVVDSFNKFERMKNKLSKTKNELGVKSLLIEQISQASKKRITELNDKVKKFETKKK
jgi:hypothetical protein